ncbi:MAG: hypothetical protein GX678_05040 [Actinomycetales bacterium]|nr:hypothetical protein [Actinomycetales bacterium]
MTTNEPPVGPTPEEPTENPPAPPPAAGEFAAASGAPYSASAAIGYGFDKFKANPGPWILALLIFVGVSVALGLVTIPFTPEADPLDNPFGFTFEPVSFIINIILTAVGYIFSAVLVRGALDETQGAKFSIGSAFSRLNLGPVILLGLLLSIGSTIGILLCVLPGIVFAFLTMFALVFLVDQDLNPIEAITASFKLCVEKLGESILTALLALLVVVLGFLACCIGLIVAVPVTQIAIAYAYKQLRGVPVA